MSGAPATAGPEVVRRTARRLLVVGWLTSAAGTIVVFNSIGFLIPIFLDRHETGHLALVNGIAIVIYFGVAAVVLDRHFNRHLSKVLRWVEEERAPDAHEHGQTLSLPIHYVKVDAVAWILAGAVFVTLNAIVQGPGFAALAGATIWLGGETTCALLYLLDERALRPITALALSQRAPSGPVGPSVRLRLSMAWALGTGVPLLGVLVVGIVGLTKSGVDTKYVAAAVIFLSAVASVVGFISTVIASRAIADPLTSVRRGLEQIERADLGASVPVDDASEVGLLQAGFNRMATGLRERERVRDLFGRHVGEEVARAALSTGTRLGGEERRIGALFVDVTGSTAMALAMPPTELVRLLNRFFRVVIDVVESGSGLVNKFEGDAALCVFGAPVPSRDPGGDALRCARELSARLSREVPEIEFGIGVSAGMAVAGNVGAEHRFEYTVIGDPVNEAARLSELAKERRGHVLASEASLLGAAEDETAAWTLTNSEFLRGRAAVTRVATPVA